MFTFYFYNIKLKHIAFVITVDHWVNAKIHCNLKGNKVIVGTWFHFFFVNKFI